MNEWIRRVCYTYNGVSFSQKEQNHVMLMEADGYHFSVKQNKSESNYAMHGVVIRN